MARRLNFDFVTVDPTKRHSGLTSADRTKVRSRAAKNDPFSVTSQRRSRKLLLSPKIPDVHYFDDTGLLSLSQIESDPILFQDIKTLQEQASHLAIISPPISLSGEEEDDDTEDDTGYFSPLHKPTRGEDQATTPQPPKLCLDTCVSPFEIPSCTTGSYQSRLLSILGVQPYPNAARVDPFWTFPIEFKACLPAVIHHEVHHLTPVVPGLDVGQERNLLRWFSMGLQEPAHLYATLAFAAAHLLDTGSAMVTPEDVLYLKCSAIAAVNEALSKPSRRLKSSLIAAVISLAAFEFAFGDTRSYNAHVEGGKQMLLMRGGWHTLDVWLQRLLNWLAGSSACWRIYWPYSRQMGSSDALRGYHRA